VLIGGAGQVQASDLMLGRRPETGSASLEQLTLDEAEELLVRNALDRSSGNVQAAADQIGLSRSAMYRRMEKYGIC
jgi:transcriptional regulator of acetoin/glycerol metabolism